MLWQKYELYTYIGMFVSFDNQSIKKLITNKKTDKAIIHTLSVFF
jgi:hypothetical protein